MTAPSYSDQVHIVKILSKASSLVAQRKESIRLLEELLKSTFLEIFGDPGTNPKSWKEIRLVDVCQDPNDIKCGPFGTQLNKGEYLSEGVPLWGIPQINSEFKIQPKEYVSFQKATDLDQYSVIPGDIVMSRKGNVGKCSIYPAKYCKGIIHSDVLRIRVNQSVVNPLFVLFQLRISNRIEDQIASVSSGAVMAGINVGKLKNIYLLVPPVSIQEQFALVVKKVEAQKVLYQQSLQELEHLYGALCQKAFRGELWPSVKKEVPEVAG